ncbi:MAG: sigma-70 family RNA polymerase sigma factor [Planctomycetota bacterium]|nr:MAG: sigma-70 family RNA polymerase sigma factor [Planctomycetota bacterium]
MNSDDHQLIQNCLQQKPDAWQKFVSQYAPLIYSLSQQTLEYFQANYSREDLEDILENVFLEFLKNNFKLLREYNPKYSLTTWIGVVVRTQVGRFLRQKKYPSQSLDVAYPKGNIPSKNAKQTESLKQIEQKEYSQLLKKALEQLPFKEALILQFAFFDEMDYKQIAKTLQISVNSVGAYLFRAKTKLLHILKKMGVEI